MIAQTPRPPYYAVIFTSLRTEVEEEYIETTERMIALAKEQQGYLGIEGAREEIGITVSYWKSLEAIKTWKSHAEHVVAQEKGKSLWYKAFKTRITKVEQDYEF